MSILSKCTEEWHGRANRSEFSGRDDTAKAEETIL
jgi:hypothetical protein